MASIGPPLTNSVDPGTLKLIQQVKWISGEPNSLVFWVCGFWVWRWGYFLFFIYKWKIGEANELVVVIVWEGMLCCRISGGGKGQLGRMLETGCWLEREEMDTMISMWLWVAASSHFITRAKQEMAFSRRNQGEARAHSGEVCVQYANSTVMHALTTCPFY